MKRRSPGFTILEILVASLILALIVGSTIISNLSIRRQMKYISGYRYTAMNLAREMMEFGEAGQLQHEFKMKYYYPSPSGCTIPGGCDSSTTDPGRAGLNYTSGYGLKEWYYFNTKYRHPFKLLGDIKTKGLVPQKFPDSVVIYYVVEKIPEDLGTYNRQYFKQSVYVTWQEDQIEQGGKTVPVMKSVALTGIPITNVNDQLRLNTAEFKWD